MARIGQTRSGLIEDAIVVAVGAAIVTLALRAGAERYRAGREQHTKSREGAQLRSSVCQSRPAYRPHHRSLVAATSSRSAHVHHHARAEIRARHGIADTQRIRLHAAPVAAAAGDRKAQEMLGLGLLIGPTLYGPAVKADRCEAAMWLRRAAAQGSEVGTVQPDL